jgi:hypothetical protein
LGREAIEESNDVHRTFIIIPARWPRQQYGLNQLSLRQADPVKLTPVAARAAPAPVADRSAGSLSRL